MTRRRTCRGSAYDGDPSGIRMSQNIRAVPGASPRHGSTWNVCGSGRASMSDSCTRAKPSIAEPSKPMPSANAPSSSAGATATDLRNPSTSVNHNRTKRMSRSSIVRRTNSCCRSMPEAYGGGAIAEAASRALDESGELVEGAPLRDDGVGAEADGAGAEVDRVLGGVHHDACGRARRTQVGKHLHAVRTGRHLVVEDDRRRRVNGRELDRGRRVAGGEHGRPADNPGHVG